MKQLGMALIIMGNFAHSMDAPERFAVQMKEKITGIRQSAKESLRNLYSHVDIHGPKDDPIERAVAETILEQEQWEHDIPSMCPEELNQLWPKVSGWYWSDAWAFKIKQRLEEFKKKHLL